MPVLASLLFLVAARQDMPIHAARYTSVVPYKVIGWRSGGFFVFETGDGSEGAETVHRLVLDAHGKIVKDWKENADEGGPSLEKQSKSWLGAHPSAGLGKTVFQFKKPWFTADKKPSPEAWARGGGYEVVAVSMYAKHEWTPGHEIEFQPATAGIGIRHGSKGKYSELSKMADYEPNVLAFGIDRIILSPNGKDVAVIARKYRGTMFEGWNVAAVAYPVVGRLP